MDNPTVFISYSHDNEDHKSWVLKLASDLRSHGVNAILDQWDLRLGSDLRFFMENGLSDANLVLCICSENYVNKVNLIIPAHFEPPVRTLRATVPENGSH